MHLVGHRVVHREVDVPARRPLDVRRAPEDVVREDDGTGLHVLLRGDGQGQFKAIWPNKSGLVVSGDMKGLAITDLNGDQKPDIVVSINNGPVQAFLAQ